MAKLLAMPNSDIISGFKGTVDFYYYLGVPVARAWPVSHGKQRTPAVMAQWPAFANASRLWSRCTPNVQAIYAAWTGPARQNARNLQIKCYLHNIYGHPIP